MRRIGLFGGSFNPIHNGHLHLAESVYQALQLDSVMLMPAGEAPHKSSAAYASGAHRFAMCRLATKSRPWLTVSDLEIKKPGRSYTVETLRILRERHPDTAWTLLLGSDMLLTFDKWYCWQEILAYAAVCAVSREENDLPALQDAADRLKEQVPGAEVTVLRVPAFPVSSTQIRENLKNHADCSCLLPENVVPYIMKNGLYSGGGVDGQGDGSAKLHQ